MKRSVSIPMISVLLGAAGLVLRLQEQKAFDSSTGLPLSSWLHGFNAAFLAAAALLCLLFALRTPKDRGEKAFTAAFAMPGAGRVLLPVLGSFLLLLCGGYQLLVYALTRALQYLLLGVLTLLSGGCFLKLTMDCRRSRAAQGVLALPVICMLALSLVLTYRAEANNPVLLDYYVDILAQAAFLLQFYYLADFAYPPAKARAYVFFAALAPVLGLTAAAGAASLAGWAFYLGLTALGLGYLTAYLQQHQQSAPAGEQENA